jgi:hypothetical protein
MAELNILYDSDTYCVAEFAGNPGIELMDKQARRSLYFEGAMAARFRRSFRSLFLNGSMDDEVDAFLERYCELPAQPIILH